LCVATDPAGNVVTSTNPTGGASRWTTTHIDGPRQCLVPAGVVLRRDRQRRQRGQFDKPDRRHPRLDESRTWAATGCRESRARRPHYASLSTNR
jgi:hypothetical protein